VTDYTSGNEKAAKGKYGELQEEGHACPVHDVQQKVRLEVRGKVYFLAFYQVT
jgi:hypothetical protein